MYHGFIKVAAVTPDVRVADPVFNADEILKQIRICTEQHAKIIVFPELALTSYTCGDLFLQSRLLEEAREQLWRICEETQELDALILIGIPAEIRGKLYNTAAVLHQGVHELGDDDVPELRIREDFTFVCATAAGHIF